MLVIAWLGLLTLTQGSPCQKLLRMRMSERSGVSLVLHVVQCALKPPYDFVPDKHYCVFINWIFCKYQPGFVNTNTNLQMPVLKTYNSWYLQITGCVLCEGEPEVWQIDCSSSREYKGMLQVRVGEIYGHISTSTGSFD